MTNEAERVRCWTKWHKSRQAYTIEFVPVACYANVSTVTQWIQTLETISNEIPPALTYEIDLVKFAYNLNELCEALALFSNLSGLQHIAGILGKPEVTGSQQGVEATDDPEQAQSNQIATAFIAMQEAMNATVRASAIEPTSATTANLKIKANYARLIREQNIRLTDPNYWHLGETLTILGKVAAIESAQFFTPDEGEYQ